MNNITSDEAKELLDQTKMRLIHHGKSHFNRDFWLEYLHKILKSKTYDELYQAFRFGWFTDDGIRDFYYILNNLTIQYRPHE